MKKLPSYTKLFNTFERYSEEEIQRISTAISIIDEASKRGLELKRAGREWRTLCCFHEERTPSLRFNPEKNSFYCHGCNAGGGVIKFVQDYDEVTFPKAMERLGGRLPNDDGRTSSRDDGQRQKKCIKLHDEKPLPPNFWSIERSARIAIYNSDDLKHRIAKQFGISDRAVESLTFTQGASIGFRSDPTYEKDGIRKPCLPDRLCYTYEHGIKIRSPFGPNAKCRFLWEHGRAALPWRSFVLEKPWANTVHVAEGETDCLTLINAGFESLSNRSVVVASPGTGFRSEWSGLFRGKTIVLWFDDDGEGQAGDVAIDRAVKILKPVAREIIIRNFPTGKEVAA
ncbi:MAG: hypothetical protein ACI9R3_005358 [Verrucomicrobiales bacterium]|jgi:hypothetical protein